MQINLEDLRRHYASLSDEALREIDRSELVELAQQCYDQELAQREPLEKKADKVARPVTHAAVPRRVRPSPAANCRKSDYSRSDDGRAQHLGSFEVPVTTRRGSKT